MNVVSEDDGVFGHPGDAQEGDHGRGDVQEAAGPRARPGTTWDCWCADWARTRWSGARWWPSRAAITPHTRFKGQVYVLKKDEGGRHTPFFNGYRPQFYFRTTDVTGVANGCRRGRRW